MTLCRTAILVGTILAYSDAATAGQGGSPPSARPGWQILESRFSRMRGMRVENLDGQRLGSVKDFVLDIRTGEVKYALVAPGGLRNLRARSRIVPARLLSNATAKESTIAVDLTLERWKNSPRLRKSEVEGLNDPARQQQIGAYYSPGLEHWRLTPAGSETPRGPGTKSKAGVPERRKPTEMKLASDLLGSPLINLQNQPIGRVSDLLIDLRGKNGAFVISESNPLRPNEKFASPLRGARVVGSGELAVDANGRAFEQARPFSEQAWQALGSEDWRKVYRFTD